jgi:chromosome segregation ATPase
MNGSESHTNVLANLKRELAEETTAARTLDAEADSAAADLAHARDAVVTAYADNKAAGIKKATAARDKAEARVAELADRQDAARIRVERAQDAAQAYEAEHARDLIAELEPDALEAVEALQRHAAELVAADRRWNNVSSEVSRLSRHISGTAPRHNARGEHKLTPIISAIRKAGGDLESPMPHWLGDRDHEKEQRNRLRISQRRRKRVDPAEVA